MCQLGFFGYKQQILNVANLSWKGLCWEDIGGEFRKTKEKLENLR